MNHKSTRTGGNRDGQCVPTDLLARILVPAMERWDKENEKSKSQWENSQGDQPQGAITFASEFIAKHRGLGPASPARRLYDIKTGISRRTSLGIADTALMAFDLDLANSGLPVLASSVRGAREMIDAHCTEIDNNLHLPDRYQLAVDLLAFSEALIHGWDTLGREAARTVAGFLQAHAPERELVAA